MQKLKPGKIEKIKQKMICTTHIAISVKNQTKRYIYYDVEEIIDGVKPKIMIKIKQLKRKMKRRK